MNIRFPTVSIFSAACLLAACGGGGGSNLPSSSTPTVTVTAPANAIVGRSFDITWTSTDAATCSTDFDDSVGKTGTVSKIESSLGAKTYSVTCSASGISTTGSATVNIVEGATAEGMWNGTTTDDRAIAGVVAHADATTQISKFFLVYSQAGNHAVAAGFVTGGGASTSTSDTDGTYASASAANALREFNFEGNGAGGGTLQATYTEKNTFGGSFNSTALAATWSLNGHMTAFDAAGVSPVFITFAPTISAQPSDPLNPPFTNILTFGDGGNYWNIDVNAAAPQFSGRIVFDAYDERVWFTVPPYDSSNVASNADINYPTTHVMGFDNTNGTVAYNSSTRTLTWTGTFATTNPPAPDFTCTGIPTATGIVCPIFPPLGISGSITLVFDDASLTTYHGTLDWLQGLNPPLPLAEMAFTGSVPSSPKVTRSYQSTYSATYELTPSLSDLQGNYTGTAGIDVGMVSGTFVVAADGSISGTSAGCTYTGTANPEAVGNVYEITLAFSGGSCAYAGAFAGVATYDAKQITVTAINGARDKGFLFVGVKP